MNRIGTKQLMEDILEGVNKEMPEARVQKVHVFFLPDKMLETLDRHGKWCVYFFPAEILIKTNRGDKNYRKLFDDDLPEMYFVKTPSRTPDKSRPVNMIEIVNELKKYDGTEYYPATIKHVKVMKSLYDKIHEKHKDDETYENYMNKVLGGYDVDII